MQGCFNIHKPVNITYKQSKGKKGQNHLNRHRKDLGQSLAFHHNQIPDETQNRRNIIQYNRGYDKPIGNIVPNKKNQKAFPLEEGMVQGYLFSSLLFNTMLETLARGIKSEKEIKVIQRTKKKEES